MVDKGKCFNCKSDFTFDNMVDHLKLCDAPLYGNDQYVLCIERKIVNIEKNDDYTVDKKPHYWTYVLVSKKTKLSDLDQFLSENWMNCCMMVHVAEYNTSGPKFANDANGKFKSKKLINKSKNKIRIDHKRYSSNISFGDVSNYFKSSVRYEYDAVLTTVLNMQISFTTNTSSNNCQPFELKILAQNSKPILMCGGCDIKELDTEYCIKCKKILCEKCVDLHQCYGNKLNYMTMTNNPRSGIACQQLNNYKVGILATSMYDMFG